MSASIVASSAWRLLLHRLAGVLDDPTRLLAGLGQLGAVLVERLLGLGARGLGRVEVGRDQLAALLEHVLDRCCRRTS